MDWEPIYWCKDEKEISKEMLKIIDKYRVNIFDYYPDIFGTNCSIPLSRCFKCAYKGTCSGNDNYGQCTKYKRDPPDGGYYG